MYKNFFFLNKFAIEADNELRGYSLTNAFTQDKEKLILALRSGVTEKFIEMSVNPSVPFIVLRNKYSRAKKNSISFFELQLPIKILSVETALYDRIIKIRAEKCALYFLIRGKHSNTVMITHEGKLLPFKNIDKETEAALVKELGDLHFSDKFSYPKFEISETETPDSLRKKYSFIGKEIINELKHRLENKDVGLNKELKKILEEVEKNKPAVFSSNKFDSIELGIETFRSIPYSERTAFESTSEAVHYYLGKKQSQGNISEIKKKIIRHIKREMERLSTKLNNADIISKRESKEEVYNKYGNLLLINLDKIKPRMAKVTIEDIYEGNVVDIPIDPSLSPDKNAELYFDKAKDDRITREKAKEMKEKFLIEFNKLKNIHDNIDKIEEKGDLISIMKELKIKDDETNPVKDELKNKFKRYIIDGKYYVFVGKDSQNNDLLTVKFAKQNDYWFHARSVPGSHVVLRTENTKENMPKNILKKAAALAAYHSKAKTAGLSPVSYTQKKYVVKKKGMEPGKVALLKEEVLLVRPEIPEGCEYITED
ncbi:MAG: NFACT RNA binding domain-containing protein [Ignavibacteriaceae bacterium]|nr:NFACT RNA binding domain-containing protein [Ignavibacteriaceae bacterium]